MRLYIILNLSIILITKSAVLGQVNCKKINNDSICWVEGLELKWSDFRGKPDTAAMTYMRVRPTALTHAEITAKGYWEGGLPNFKVLNRFIRHQSWVIDTTRLVGLNHERLHFDIAELYARKIRKGIYELRQKKFKNFDVYVELINKNLKELKDRSDKYDLETGHSVVAFKQKQWQAEIWKELNALKDYKSTPQMCN